MRDRLILATYALSGVGVFAFVGWWMWSQWQECRAAGLSVFYCIQHLA